VVLIHGHKEDTGSARMQVMRSRQELDPINFGKVQVRRDKRDVSVLISKVRQDGQSLVGFRCGSDGIVGAESAGDSRLGSKASCFIRVHDKQNRGVSVAFDSYNLSKTQRSRCHA
jgi:hypothetical protein